MSSTEKWQLCTQMDDSTENFFFRALTGVPDVTQDWIVTLTSYLGIGIYLCNAMILKKFSSLNQ